MLNLFISHAWADKMNPQFGNLYTELEGYDLWIDKTNIAPGKDIRTYVRDGIERADVVIVFWSAAASASDDVQFELETAVALGKELIPCTLDNSSLEKVRFLRGRLYIDLRNAAVGALGWMRLRYILTEYFLAKNESRFMNLYDEGEKEKRAAMLTSLKAKQAIVQKQIAFLQDTAFRVDNVAPNRDQANPYMLNMVKSIEATMETDGSPSALQVREFMTFIQEVFTRLPGDDSATLRFRDTLLRVKLSELDPNGSNQSLTMFRNLLALSASEKKSRPTNPGPEPPCKPA